MRDILDLSPKYLLYAPHRLVNQPAMSTDTRASQVGGMDSMIVEVVYTSAVV